MNYGERNIPCCKVSETDHKFFACEPGYLLIADIINVVTSFLRISFLILTDIYRIMLSDKKYGLSVNIMATRVMPSLIPHTVNPSLNLEQFTILLEVLNPPLLLLLYHTVILSQGNVFATRNSRIFCGVYFEILFDIT